ncbi:MAG TPA: hypothetical protein VIL74_07840 [Pyrinomonadaceae bacterium]|jgi:hypothetical protein
MQNPGLNDRRRLMILTLTCLILSLGGSAGAQSGRKNQTKNQPPPPIETPTPEPTPKPKSAEPIVPGIPVKVVSSSPQTAFMVFPFPENMPRWVAERLSSSSPLAVQAGGSANLPQAEKLAKAATDTFIVHVELEENPFAGPTPGGTRASNGQYWINFHVLTPVTGKIKKRGRIRLSPEILRGVGGVLNRKRSCAANMSNDDYLLREASFETAERVIASFDLPVPPRQCKPKI